MALFFFFEGASTSVLRFQGVPTGFFDGLTLWFEVRSGRSRFLFQASPFFSPPPLRSAFLMPPGSGREDFGFGGWLAVSHGFFEFYSRAPDVWAPPGLCRADP